MLTQLSPTTQGEIASWVRGYERGCLFISEGEADYSFGRRVSDYESSEGRLGIYRMDLWEC